MLDPVLSLTYISVGLSLLLLAALSLNIAVIIALHLSHRRRALAEERALLARPLPADHLLPLVLVQLPVFNERHVIGRLIETAAGIDWPLDRLEIQVLDDSTDETTEIARRAVERLQAKGIRVQLARRGGRTGFKAGALAYGLARSDAEFVAIFDADFLPPRDFLRRCIRPLLADRQLALVQTRWDHLNATESLLTRAQALQLDAHFAIEQSARAWSGLGMPFNGTCGLWRRRAIEDAGGWHIDTLTEDLDLSFRAHMKGWRTTILHSVGVPGELPNDLAAWRVQQHRWNKGFAQCARKLMGPIWRSDFPWWRKIAASCHLGQCCFWPLAIVALANAFGALLLGRQQPLALVALGCTATGLGIGSVLTMTCLARRELGRGRPAAFLTAYLALLALNAGLTFANATAVAEGLLGLSSGFVRTPKCGDDKTSSYRSAMPTGAPELVFSVVGCTALVWDPNWTAPFLCISVAGFLWIGWEFGRAHLGRVGFRGLL
jgi:cellulose synthase/poly-beta-1,6-N-acetylglucosamine synthase-like glycosyltransferase